MLCYGGPERNVFINLYATNKSSLVSSWSKVTRHKEYDFLVGVGDLLALSQSFLSSVLCGML